MEMLIKSHNESYTGQYECKKSALNQLIKIKKCFMIMTLRGHITKSWCNLKPCCHIKIEINQFFGYIIGNLIELFLIFWVKDMI